MVRSNAHHSHSPPPPASRLFGGSDNSKTVSLTTDNSNNYTSNDNSSSNLMNGLALPLRSFKKKPLSRQKTWSEPSNDSSQHGQQQQQQQDQSSSSFYTGGSNTTTTTTTTTTTVAPVISVAKTINQLLHNPSNRCCADCRSALVDSSQIHASFRPPRLNGFQKPGAQQQSLVLTRTDLASQRNFVSAHRAFAPPPPPKQMSMAKSFSEMRRNSSGSLPTKISRNGKTHHSETNGNLDVIDNDNKSHPFTSSNSVRDINQINHNNDNNNGNNGVHDSTSSESLRFRSSASLRDNILRQITMEPPAGLQTNQKSQQLLSVSSSPNNVTPPNSGYEPTPANDNNSDTSPRNDNNNTRAKVFTSPAMDPAYLAYRYVPPHGVFLCAQCAHAHQLLGDDVTIVRHVQEYQTWTAEEALAMKVAGGNTMGWNIYEAYLPEDWRRRRPNHASRKEDRLTFCRAKYEIMGFVLPPVVSNTISNGGAAHSNTVEEAWKRLMQHNPWALQNQTTASELNNLVTLTLHRRAQGLNQYAPQGKYEDLSSAAAPIQQALPQRLVDYFCVVGTSGFLDPRLLQREDLDLSTLTGPEELDLEPRVMDCYPSQKFHNDMEFPEHVATFVLPEGCRPSDSQKSPFFFSFVLTTASGHRLYGASLRLYDEAIETQELRESIEKSGYTGAYPPWLPPPLPHQQQQQSASDGAPSVGSSRGSSDDYMDIVYLPKCLVVLSHYPFFDLFRNFLLQLYRITLVEAPLPIERFVANFCCEIPLPPQGKVEVKFGFTVKDIWSIQRPPENQLPLANFSYKPIFACLSVGNIMTVLGCLMEESRVALCSRHYALLTPIAEALVSFLFPLQWQGMYIPVMPFAMLDILDAPVPYLVGLHSRYLIETKPHMRPQGVVFVDVDRDIVHLGFEDDSNALRMVPALPEKGALKLRSKLEEHGSSMYLVPDNAKLEGSAITTGHGKILSDTKREAYATTFYSPSAMPGTKESSSLPGNDEFQRSEGRAHTLRRRAVLRAVDKAYQENELLTPITGFLSEQGQLYGREPARQAKVIQKGGMGKIFNIRRLRSQSSMPDDDQSGHFNGNFTAQSQGHANQQGLLLDLEEPLGFNSQEIRNAFLRFFVSFLKGYEQFLITDNPNQFFRVEEFLADLNLTNTSYRFVEKVVKTQMFSRFLEERQNDPCDPLFLFFDECIIAKQNRSRRINVRQKDTPFLDDPSGAIKETFTPPPPSNWGLPDDDRKYHYGSFPKLNHELFGKIRQAMRWKMAKSSSLRGLPMGSMPASNSWQHEILSRTLAPKGKVQTTVYWAAKQGYKTLEWSITALSQPSHNNEQQPTSENSWSTFAGRKGFETSKGKFSPHSRGKNVLKASIINGLSTSSLLSAQNILLNARRIKGVHLRVICITQSLVRMHQARRKYVRFLKALRFLQYKWRRHVPEGLTEMDELEKARHSVAKVQRVIRSFLMSRDLRKKRASVAMIQRWYRGTACRKRILYLERACRRIQTLVRTRRAQFGLKMLKNLIAKLQARSRGWLARRRITSLNERRMSRYREQIFLLWNRTHTPLSYRTKFWPLISDQCGFLRLRIAESELERLWIVLEVDFNSKDFAEPNDAHEQHKEELRLGKVLGITDHTFWRYLIVKSMTASVLLFPAEERRNSELRLASDRVEAERIQIYDRISANTPRIAALLWTLYGLFKIDKKDKSKKYRLAEVVWTDQSTANQSEMLMMQVFPELEEASNIIFNLPSKKILKRFRNVNPIPPRLGKSMWAHSILKDQISRNVREVAVNALQGVKMPAEKTKDKKKSHTPFVPYTKSITEARYMSRRRVSMMVSVGRPTKPSVKDVRRRLIDDLLESRTWEGK